MAELINEKLKFCWTSSQCECNEPALANSKYKFYSSFKYNNIEYEIGDFVIVLKSMEPGQFPRSMIAKLKCLYKSSKDIHSNEPYRGTVQWYTRAEDIPQCFNKNNFKMDKKFEVVEDLRSLNTFISLQNIKKRCNIIFPTTNEEIDETYNLVKTQTGTFICKYKIEDNCLIPICTYNISNNIQVLREVNNLNRQFASPKMKIVSPMRTIFKKSDKGSSDSDLEILGSCNYSAKKIFTSDHINYKRSASVETITDDDESQENSNKARSPKSPAKIMRLSPSKRTVGSNKKGSNPMFSPLQKDGVKRNLNSSFGETPDKSILNYSIVEEFMNSDSPLKIKLKVSNKKVTSPTILLKRLSISDKDVDQLLSDEDKIVLTSIRSPKKSEKKSSRISFCEKEENNVRRSSRPIRKVSYADFVSPRDEVNSPNSRTPRKISSENKNEKTTPQRRTRKKSVELDDVHMFTPRRSTRRNSVEVQEGPIGTPRKSAKKALEIIHETLSQASPDTETPRRLSKKPLKYKDYETSGTPSKVHGKQSKKLNKTRNVFDSSEEEGSENESPRRRRSRKPLKYIDFELQETPSKKATATPKKTTKYVTPVKTPHAQRQSVSTPKSILKSTPGSRAKLIREGVIQPSVQSRESLVVQNNTPLALARTQLHVSYVPQSLPCREKEFKDIFNFLEGKLKDKCGGCMYVSGVPGTGKTATVTEVIRCLQESSAKRKVPNFTHVNINGMRLSEPRQAYVEILKQLNGKSLAWEQAQTILENKFTKSTKKTVVPTVLIVDELDILCTKRQDVVYNLLDWPTKSNAQLIVVTIANTMDLPERLLMSRVTSRLGLTRLTFQAYTHKQLQEIVMKRLSGTNAFNPDAVQLVARKVASVSGDARRALDICRRAAEIAELEGKATLVSLKHINVALNAMITQPKVQAIKHCSRLEQLFLQAVVAEVERTGVEETCFASVYSMLPSIASLDGFKMISITLALSACSRLGSCRLLLVDKTDIYQKIILNVSADDVYYALRDD